jgi:hypothetical protein
MQERTEDLTEYDAEQRLFDELLQGARRSFEQEQSFRPANKREKLFRDWRERRAFECE